MTDQTPPAPASQPDAPSSPPPQQPTQTPPPEATTLPQPDPHLVGTEYKGLTEAELHKRTQK